MTIKKHRQNFATRANDGRLSIVPTKQFVARFPLPLMMLIQTIATAQGVTKTEVVLKALQEQLAQLEAQATAAPDVVVDLTANE